MLGADGLIGRAVCDALLAAGHHPLRGTRQPQGSRPPGADDVYVDFNRDLDALAWTPRLHRVDAVVNAVGIFAERGGQSFRRIHAETPGALAQACRDAGIRRFVQVSALGADEHARSAFHRSKREGDAAVLAALPTAIVVQPSLVFSPQGASSRMLLTLAALPWLILPDRGQQPVQPIHVADLACLIVRLLDNDAPVPDPRIAAVGPRALSLADYLATLRHAMGGGRPWIVGIPGAWLARLGALTGGWIDPEALAMLARGNTASAQPITRVLGRMPRAPEQFLSATEAREVRRVVFGDIFLALGRVAIALVWLVTGVVSLGLYPVTQSLQLLAAVGLHGALATLALYAAALLDLALGLVTLLLSRRRALYLLQAAIILGYTAIISVALPQFWLHPFGPILKNLPMLVLIGALYATGRR